MLRPDFDAIDALTARCMAKLAPVPTLTELTKAASMVFGIPVSDLVSTNRSNRHARARWAVMYIARHDKGTTYPALGRHFGGRDHTTVLSGVRRMGQLMDQCDRERACVASVKAVAAKLAQVRTDTVHGQVSRLHAESARATE